MRAKIMRAKIKLLVTATVAAFALLITGTLLAEIAVYELPQREWSNLRGGASACGLCDDWPVPCESNDQACWKTGGDPNKTWCEEQYPTEQIDDYVLWTISVDPSEPTATTSNFGPCKEGYTCTWDDDEKTCTPNRPGGYVEVDRGCKDKYGSHGSP